jgi:rhamnogalacturonyl hydrolase YesR
LPKSHIIRFFKRFGKTAANGAYAKVSGGMTGDQTVEDTYERLFAWCEKRGFAGSDPFDGLNSRIYQLSPLKLFRPTRLAVQQVVKRVGFDPRPLLLVPDGVNPKTLALFALAELSRFQATGDAIHATRSHVLLERLRETSIEGENWTAFGYNFDWQSRAFYAPRGTPAIVPTAFACTAFMAAYEAFGEESYLELSERMCRFITSELNRSVDNEEEICFSYTPLDNTRVLNASLLAGECLARVGAATGNEQYLELASKAVRFVIRRQRNDGAFVYGEGDKQAWVDNFHTAYILLSLKRITTHLPELGTETEAVIENGRRYWIDNFFLADGTPKYYDHEVYPIDVHSAAAAIAVLSELGERELAAKVFRWTTANMLDAEGYFYYQIRRRDRVVKTPHMRWGQAWMAYAIAKFLEAA